MKKGGFALKIVVGADHGGFQLKEEIKQHLLKQGYEVVDVGTDGTLSVDYPDYAHPAAEMVARGEAERGILVCGTGIGMSITANKVKGIRCALVHDCFTAEATRQHNDSNMLAMGARVIGSGLALKIVDIWLGTEFEGGRHQRRLDKITQLETEQG